MQLTIYFSITILFFILHTGHLAAVRGSNDGLDPFNYLPRCPTSVDFITSSKSLFQSLGKASSLQESFSIIWNAMSNSTTSVFMCFGKVANDFTGLYRSGALGRLLGKGQKEKTTPKQGDNNNST